MHKILGYLLIVYVLACAYYYIATRSMETPFNDSLTKEQIDIKNKSSSDRSCVFYRGVLFSFIIVAVFYVYYERKK